MANLQETMTVQERLVQCSESVLLRHGLSYSHQCYLDYSGSGRQDVLH